MTGFDYAVLLIIGLSALRGLWRGLLAELFALIGWIAALILAGIHPHYDCRHVDYGRARHAFRAIDRRARYAHAGQFIGFSVRYCARHIACGCRRCAGGADRFT